MSQNRGAPVIPGFESVKLLGSGGFSDVYLYRQKLPRRRVAVKVLRSESLDRQSRKQFVAEANLMARLSSHPAIATIYTAGVSESDEPYLVMEFCSGGSLGMRFREAPLNIAELLVVGVRVASALEAAHRKGVVHRDVKPANILINDYGAPVLSDFGISIGKDIGDETTTVIGNLRTTSTGSAETASSGFSIPWAPPEVFADDPISDEGSDIFSLGATLFSLAEGRTPFEIPGGNNGMVQLIRRIERGEVNPSTRRDLPKSLHNNISRAMSAKRRDRYPTALAFAQALQSVQRELSLAETSIELGAENAVPDVEEATGRRRESIGTGLDQTHTEDLELSNSAAGIPQGAATKLGGGAAAISQVSLAARGPRRRRRMAIWLVSVVAAVAIAGSVSWIAFASKPAPPAPKKTHASALAVPTAPQNVFATAVDGSATVSWDAPKSIGESAIISYQVTTSPLRAGVDLTCVTTLLSCTIDELYNGGVYSFTVSATNSQGVSAPSVPSMPVTPLLYPLVASVAPSFSGVMSVGSVLTGDIGTWTGKWGVNGVRYTYKWMRDGQEITGATAKSYTITSSDVGHEVRFAVTASRRAYTSTTATSAAKSVGQ
jgi:eukaryotic-like serine/threonine-protein kinase